MVRCANLIVEPFDRISNILPRKQKLLFRNLESQWVMQPQSYPFREYYSLILWNWNVALHWMYKFKFDTNYQIPETKRGRLAYMKEFGVWLGSIFNLCDITIQWRDYLDIDRILYPDSERWFKLIAHEIKNTQFSHLAKTASTNDLRNDLGILREQENPYDQIKRKHTYRLIDASLRLLKSRKDPNFQKDQWIIKRKKVPFGQEGFIHAYSRMLRAEAKPKRQTFFIQNNRLLLRHGRGSDVLLIPPFMNEKKLIDTMPIK